MPKWAGSEVDILMLELDRRSLTPKMGSGHIVESSEKGSLATRVINSELEN